MDDIYKKVPFYETCLKLDLEIDTFFWWVEDRCLGGSLPQLAYQAGTGNNTKWYDAQTKEMIFSPAKICKAPLLDDILEVLPKKILWKREDNSLSVVMTVIDMLPPERHWHGNHVAQAYAELLVHLTERMKEGIYLKIDN